MSESYGSYPNCYSKVVDDLYELDNGICPLCGKKVNKKNLESINVDHIVPQIVFKYANNSRLNRLCNGYSNLLLVHKACNLKKGIDLLDINVLYLSKQRKQDISSNIAKCKEYIDNFEDIRGKKIAEQKSLCAICSTRLATKDAILRRKDCKTERKLENCFAICKICNQKYSSYKHINSYEEINFKDFKENFFS